MAGKYLKSLIVLLAVSALFACKANTPKKTDLAKHQQKLALSYGSSGAAFSPDGNLLALANRNIVWVIDTRSRQVVERVAGATALGALTAILIPIAALTGSGDLVMAMGEATVHVASNPVHTLLVELKP